MMVFEFDENKSLANLEEHGIDFYDAQALWEDPDLLEFPANFDNEAKFLVIGRITAKILSAIITYRGKNVRLISVRRSRKKEVVLYESEIF